MKSFASAAFASALTLGAVAHQASAYEYERTDGIRPFIGASVGRVDVNADQFEDDSDTATSVFAGVDLGKTWGLELGYVDLGGSENEFFTTETQGFQLGVLAHLFNTEHFDLFIKGGMISWETEIDSDIANATNDGEELFWGVGSDIYLTDSFAITVGYTRYEVELEDAEVGELASGSDYNLNKLAAGIKFSF